MTKTQIQDKTWAVILYRRESDGWKKQESSTQLSTKTNRHRTRTTSVAPRKDCIVFPTLRQKFSFQSETDRGTVIRRDDKILLVSKRRARALLLQFQSLEDCLEFSDHLLNLNPRPNLEPLSPKNDRTSDQNDEAVLPIVEDEGHKEVVSWIIKMLHDESFLNFVDKIENYISASDDGKQILQGLEQRGLRSA